MAYGITSSGFETKPFEVIKTELEIEFKDAFGSDIDVSTTSVIGQLIGNLAIKYANIWEILASLYASFSPDNSSGVSLDEICALTGIARLPATKTTAHIICYGTASTTIPISHRVSQINTEKEMETLSAFVIEMANAADVQISFTVVNSFAYQVTINGFLFEYTSDASATVLEIQDGLLALINASSDIEVTATKIGDYLRLLTDDGEINYSLVLGSNITVEILGTVHNYSAIIAEEFSVPANTITEIVNPISGLDSINNIIAGLTGREDETDDDLRIRRRNSLLSLGSATDEAIAARLQQNVEGVLTAQVHSNRTDNIDSEGRPPHSFETIVQGGTDADIGLEIWNSMPSGIQSHGNTSTVVYDSSNNPHTIYFSRPVPIYIWAQLSITLYNEEIYGGDDLVKSNMVEWADEHWGIGVDVIRQRLFVPIYKVEGIGSVVLLIGSSTNPATPPGSYAATDISIGVNELALLATDRIAITIP